MGDHRIHGFIAAALIFSFIIILLQSAAEAASISCSTQDVRALLGFKAGVTSDPSGTLSSWKRDSNKCCSWKGISCNSKTGRVTQLQLPNAELGGSISPSLSGLSQLEVLKLENNNFHGGIPSSIGQLSNLKQLNLASNPLAGSIPESLGRLSNLQQLDLSTCSLTGTIPQSVGNMTSLQHIRISFNSISGPIPDSFGLLSNLFNADLAYNLISGPVPDSFTRNLTNLFFLYLDHNNITAVPSDLSRLQNVQIAYLSFNDLTLSSIAGLATLPKLGELHLSSCHLSGPFPQWVAELPRLEDTSDEVDPTIDLSDNALTGPIPDKLGSVEHLEYLGLSNNRLSGPIPTALANLTSLRNLDLSQNRLSGSIPAVLDQIDYLEFFNVSYNHLTGQIPQVSPFTTYPVSSYEGNPGLCGSPLPACKRRMD